jgi:ribonuclease R
LSPSLKKSPQKKADKKTGYKYPEKPTFPSNAKILKFIEDSSGRVGKREIARAFKLDAKQKMILKKVLREMKLSGAIQKGRGKRINKPGTLPPVTVLKVIGPDQDGDLLARPEIWETDNIPPIIYIVTNKNSKGIPGFGERILARITPVGDGTFEARIIRVISGAPDQVLGIFDIINGQGRVCPTDRRSKSEFMVEARDNLDASPGDLVRAEPLPSRRLGLRQARIVEHIKVDKGKQIPSMISIVDHDLPTRFSDAALKQATEATAAPSKGRVDLRNIPLVTIDGPDARDFDDAVWAELDPNKENVGGWHLLVAIADVAWYVRPGDALDTNAYERGNSVYFPDRVIPMLPKALSNGWCSLVPREDRPCMAAHLWIDAEGNLLKFQFIRGVMRSHARLNYQQVQQAYDGNVDKVTEPILKTVIKPLYGAYAALQKNREKRGVLELDMPERKVQLDNDGNVKVISMSERLDSHKLIEEFMISANVAAAKTIEKASIPCLYRVHDEPSQEKLNSLRKVLSSINISFEKGGVASPKRFNRILKLAKNSPHAEMVNVMVLRSQAKAEYAPDNLGHFGLALNRYSHFTSPIRRYADLLVHRALIQAGGLDDKKIKEAQQNLVKIGEHLSDTERRAAGAERDAIDRFTANYLANRIGGNFQGRINGVTRFGLFITLNDTGADGLVPIRTLRDDYYIHDETYHLLKGRQTGREFRLGENVNVCLDEASTTTGGLIFSLIDTKEIRNNAKVKKNSGLRKHKLH